MVERTQAASLPDPYDPSPVKQGIGVYYTDIEVGGVSFAVVEDRKFKSAPKTFLPDAEIWNGWPQNASYNAKISGDAPGAELLGKRQEDFLKDWISDWSRNIWMKVLLSQTIFSNIATLPAGSKSGSIIPSLPTLEPGEYADNDEPVSDHDSNGWPQSGRNRALRVLQKGFGVHIAGDQHLGSTVQYGVDEWRDAGFALCVPSVANFWPRRWFPKNPGKNRWPDAARYAGDFEDGFGNLMTVHAVSNPHKWGKMPERLHNRAPGYGIARFHRTTRKISFENWPRWSDPAAGGEPYPGWPVTFYQEDNFAKTPAGYLPTIRVEGMDNPVIQVVKESDGEIVYTIRAKGNRYRPKVFDKGVYAIRVGDPGTDKMKSLTGLTVQEDEKHIDVIF
jgi:hypothetical protein